MEFLVSRVGVVAIGRNEGERLGRCLRSLDPSTRPTVYVDSGSADGSPELARSLGAHVVLLDLSIPFTAARARNAGIEALLTITPDVEYVQFVDGDCEVDGNWLATAETLLDSQSELAVVCGRRRERFPEASVYNRLCDIEWDTPVGPASACGGDAMMRIAAFQAVGGYRPELIAGEEPELCVRLRANGGQIVRIDAEMTRHDADMKRFRQWWARNVRAGHAFAEVSRLHRGSSFGIWARETRSNWFWGLGLPVLAIVPAPLTWGLSLAFLGGYLAIFVKIFHQRRRSGDDSRTARLFAFFCVLSKFPQMLGQLRFCWNRVLGRQNRLIEYKGQRASG
jgi:glycosyltransferase involved in cell wall biosynthesis